MISYYKKINWTKTSTQMAISLVFDNAYTKCNLVICASYHQSSAWNICKCFVRYERIYNEKDHIQGSIFFLNVKSLIITYFYISRDPSIYLPISLQQHAFPEHYIFITVGRHWKGNTIEMGTCKSRAKQSRRKIQVVILKRWLDAGRVRGSRKGRWIFSRLTNGKYQLMWLRRVWRSHIMTVRKVTGQKRRWYCKGAVTLTIAIIRQNAQELQEAVKR